jgi:hypothetical protein
VVYVRYPGDPLYKPHTRKLCLQKSCAALIDQHLKVAAY